MPWQDQPLGAGPWEEQILFNERRDQYSEMGNITYEDAQDNRYDFDLWVDQAVASGPWA